MFLEFGTQVPRNCFLKEAAYKTEVSLRKIINSFTVIFLQIKLKRFKSQIILKVGGMHVHHHLTFRPIVFHWTIMKFPEIQTGIFR